MPRLRIDNREVDVPPGATLLDAARKLGLEIPTLCFRPDYEPSVSCMVCVVKLKGRAQWIPSCATLAEDGMEVESETAEIHAARRAALEMLLSDHVGDCEAPCRATCPSHMNIPLMLRQIQAGAWREALITVKQHIALPAVLGRICPEICEKACRRAAHDGAVSICALKRFVADHDLAGTPWLPACKPRSGKSVAIIGAGPAGLAAAYYLLQEGCGCMLFDQHPLPGGNLRYAVPEEKLPRNVLDQEIGIIKTLGGVFTLSTEIDNEGLARLRREFDAVFVATGSMDKAGRVPWSFLGSLRQHLMEHPGAVHLSTEPGLFVGGGVVRTGRHAIRAVADGRAVALAVAQFLGLEGALPPLKLSTSRIGKLAAGEVERFLPEGNSAARVNATLAHGLADAVAPEQAARCLHCDCRKADSCLLRRHSENCGAKQAHFHGVRRPFEQVRQHATIVYEPGKCIRCGLCIQAAVKAGETLGLTFIGRGFDVRVGVPFSATLAEGLRQAGEECAAVCPTGALALTATR